jgi:hypothetical protein
VNQISVAFLFKHIILSLQLNARMIQNFNFAGMMEELHATSQKMVKGYEVLSKVEEVQVATTPT